MPCRERGKRGREREREIGRGAGGRRENMTGVREIGRGWEDGGMRRTRRVYCLFFLQLQIIQLDEDRGEFVLRATFDHPYPTTKIMWIPDQTAQLPDLVATSGDYLRLWRVTESQVRQECMLNNVSC